MFVGREREVAELEAGLARTRAGAGGLYLIAGEPGIGKSRLAAEVAARARGHGLAVTWGRCWEAGGAPALWPWREALETAGLGVPDPAAVATADPGEARFAFFRQVSGVLARHAATSPLVIVLEDLHAADRMTLLLLELVAGQLHAMPVLVIGTYRDLEVSLRADLRDSIVRLGRLGQLLQLARLHAADVAMLVHDRVGDADEALVASVFETTQGNALFVDEIVRDLVAHGSRSGLPLGVREIIRQRLQLVSVDARAVLEVAAVLGVEVVPAVLRRLAPADAIDEVIAAGVLVARADRLRFSHALYREALYHDLPRNRREALHREVARVLASVGVPLGELAHHLLEAGPEVAGEAIDHAIRAAELALDGFAFEDARAILERARAAIPPGADETTLRCRVSIALGAAALRSGDASGRTACAEAAQVARTLDDPALLAAAGLAYGSVFVMGGVDPVLVGILEEALARLPEVDTALRARVMARLAAARQPSPQHERGRDIDLGLAAIDMARRVAGRRELLTVLQAACGVLYGAVDPKLRLPIARELETLAEELGDTTTLLQARVRMALDFLELGDFASYAQLAHSYEQLASRIGPAAAPWRVPLMRSMCALVQDRFVESERWQAEARRIDADGPRARRAETFHRIGFLRAAERHVELRAAIPELRSAWLGMPYGTVLAEARVASVLAWIGAPDDEIRAIIAALPDAAIAEQINSVGLAESAWALADASLAARIAPTVGAYGERWVTYWLDSEIAEAPITRLRAYLAALVGSWDDCERHFAHALGAVEAVGRRSMAARMRFELGDLFVRLGHDLERARALVATARDEAAGQGLVELVALVDRRHPRGSAPPVRATQPPRFALVLEGEYYAVTTARGTLRFKSSRGMQYLAALVERPHVEVHVLELVGSADRADRGDAGPLVDGQAVRAYRERLAALRDQVETAELLGDGDRAERARSEMEAIAAELQRSTGKAGRARRADSAVDRARSAVQRRVKDALDRIAEADADLGTWLRRCVHTGNYCSYRPAD